MINERPLEYLSSLNEARIKPGLERITEALKVLGNPHLSYPHVLIGGTNGKGSVISFMGSVLETAGYAVGIFTSPHLHSFTERIAIGREHMLPEELVGLVKEVRKTGINLSYFEFATVMGLYYFQQKGVDLALLEVGLGGRWDASNATDPFLSIITTIAMDHSQWLGNSIEEVALEKAQILRAGRTAVLGGVDDAASAVILETARDQGTSLRVLGKNFTFVREDSISFEGKKLTLAGIKLGMAGEYQTNNAACALAALEYLTESGFNINKRSMIKGLGDARWPGRFQIIPGSPRIVIDSAHNPAAVEALILSLERERLDPVWVFSALEDKDVASMAEAISVSGQPVVLVPLKHERGMDLGRIQKIFQKMGIFTTRSSSVMEGLSRARELAGSDGTIVTVGSLFLAAEIIEILGDEGAMTGGGN